MKILAVICCIVVFLLVVLTVILYRMKSRKPYKQEAYYQVTKITKSKLKRDSDQYGKYLTYKNLQYLESAGCKFLFNLYIPKKDKETTVIDVLAITHKGLIIVESKNFNGRIFGKQCEKYWTQSLSRDRHSRFYNPILQNATHVLYLDKLMTEKSYPLFSVIAFADRCRLDGINICFNSVPVVHHKDLPAVIAQIDNNNPAILSNFEIEQLYEVLYPYSQVNENIKNTHIQTVYEYANAY